ncbi:NUDIX domain-containing protein [Candidatus Microgenomates bacterium]|nr:NUDIX domain-containing protein [Candidatus Microgenomates bacterium]
MISAGLNNKQKEILVGGSVVYKKDNGKTTWFLVKQDMDSDWELPKTNVRRGESSVRSVIRAMAEQGGMKAKVLEEVGRNTKAVMHNGKPIDQKVIFYLLIERGGGEALGFAEYQWMDYAKASKKLDKKDQKMLKIAKDLAKEVEKKAKKNPLFEEVDEFEKEIVEGTV